MSQTEASYSSSSQRSGEPHLEKKLGCFNMIAMTFAILKLVAALGFRIGPTLTLRKHMDSPGRDHGPCSSVRRFSCLHLWLYFLRPVQSMPHSQPRRASIDLAHGGRTIPLRLHAGYGEVEDAGFFHCRMAQYCGLAHFDHDGVLFCR
jgi:hypothetical protein